MKETGNTSLIWELSEEDYNLFVRMCNVTDISASYSKYLERIKEAKNLSLDRGDHIVLLRYTLRDVLDALKELDLTWSSENCHKALMYIMNNDNNTKE